MRLRNILALGAMASLVAGISSVSAAVTLDFGDSTINALAGPVDPTAYLAGFGITVTNVTSGAAMQIQDDRWTYGGGVVVPTSAHNFMEQGGGFPVSYELDFSSLVSAVNFWRIGVIPPTSMPQWSASFYNGATLVDGVGENFFGGANIPAAHFSLTGTGNRLVVQGSHGGFAAFQTLIMDDLSFTPVPEPGSLALAAVGLLGLTGRRRQKAK